MNHGNFLSDQSCVEQIWLVAYINRSGSTFLLNELCKYKQIVALPEGERLVKFFLEKPYSEIKNKKTLISEVNTMIQSDPKLNLFGVFIEYSDLVNCKYFIDLFFRLLVKSARHIKPASKIIVFKDTRLINYFAKISKYNFDFKLRFIVLSRDPRAIYCSQRNTIGSWGVPMATNPVITAKDWNQFERRKIGLNYLSVPNIFLTSFEKLISNLDGEIDNLLVTFGLSAKSMVKENESSYLDLVPVHLKSIHQNIVKPPVPDKINNWESLLSYNEIYTIQNIAKQYMELENYKQVEVDIALRKPLILNLMWYIGYWVEKFKRTILPNRDLPKCNK